MSFDILLYLDELTDALAVIGKEKRIAFAAWCCEPLMSGFLPYLGKMTSRAFTDSIRHAVDNLWHTLKEGVDVDQREMGNLKNAVNAIMWDETSIEDGDDFWNDGAIELLGCLRRTFECAETGSARCAAEAADRVINMIDYELLMIQGVEDSLDHPLMTAEIDRQREMVRFLSHCDGIKEEYRRLFRPSELPWASRMPILGDNA